MLVLERCRDAAICIGQGIKIKVLRTGKSRVLLGVEASRGVPVWREELGPPQSQPTQSSADPVSLHVLLVEDDPGHRRLITTLLQECGIANLVAVPSAEEAEKLLNDGSATRPDLVVLDLGLPGMSGLELLQRIKSVDRLRTTPVVILSSMGDEEQIARCLEAGANAYVTKSPRLDDFRQSIFRIAEFWKMTRHVA